MASDQFLYGLPFLREKEEENENGKIKIELGHHKMEAYLTVVPPRGGAPVTRQAIENALSEKNVVYGIKDENIDLAVKLQCLAQPLIVAAGAQPVDGEDGKIHFNSGPSALRGKPTEMADGRVDFYNLHLINNVAEGDVLAVKIPPTPGNPGYTVTGEEIGAKPGKDIRLLAGKNVEIVDDTTAVALTQGHMLVKGNKISISSLYEIPADVDFNTGNIEFNGSVFVGNNINEGFKVVASGDVEVMGTISGGFVECSGDLKVRNGIIGRNKTHIKAGGSIYTRFIENAAVEAGENVIVGEAVMHSTVNAGLKVLVQGKGVIVGGMVRACEEINCKIAGSQMSAATCLETGVSPALRDTYNRLLREKAEKEANYDKACKAVALLSRMKRSNQEMHPDKKSLLAQVSSTQSQLVGQLQALTEAIPKIEQLLEKSERGRIKVQGVIYPGVKITIGNFALSIEDEYPFVCLTKHDGNIRISPYS